MAPICTLSNGSKMAPSSTDQYLGPLSARIEGSFFQDLESRSISRTPKWVLLILFRERGLVRKKCIILFYWSLNWPRTCTMIGNCFFFLNRSYSYTYFHLVGCLDLVLTICCPPYNTTQDFEICIYYYISIWCLSGSYE